MGKKFDLKDLRDSMKNCLGERCTDEFLDWLRYIDFYLCPASKGHHGNYPGGLRDHSIRVAEELENLTEKLGLEWERPESPWVVGLLHDICKTDDYEIDKASLCMTDNMVKNGAYKYSPKIHPGHGIKSVWMLAGHFDMTEEEKMCITYHMGAFTDKSEWEFYSRAVSKYPNVLYTHTADMIASNIHNM